jgi:putative aminopeptidase FrvX
MNAEHFVSHVAAYKAHKAGATTPVFLIGPGCKYGHWQCGTPHGPWQFRIA